MTAPSHKNHALQKKPRQRTSQDTGKAKPTSAPRHTYFQAESKPLSTTLQSKSIVSQVPTIYNSFSYPTHPHKISSFCPLFLKRILKRKIIILILLATITVSCILYLNKEPVTKKKLSGLLTKEIDGSQRQTPADVRTLEECKKKYPIGLTKFELRAVEYLTILRFL